MSYVNLLALWYSVEHAWLQTHRQGFESHPRQLVTTYFSFPLKVVDTRVSGDCKELLCLLPEAVDKKQKGRKLKWKIKYGNRNR